MNSADQPPNKKRFSRKVEDFICIVCGSEVRGNGYTDHCPKCLSSIHVDINPGDRESKCEGLMKPVLAEYERGEFFIYYRCEKCGFKHKVRAADQDNKELLIGFTPKSR